MDQNHSNDTSGPARTTKESLNASIIKSAASFLSELLFQES